MGLAQRAAYRNGFLRSEAWKDIRYKSLARWKSECFICQKADFSNDVHHVWYPRILGKTTTENTRVLCRECHTEVHRRMKLDPFFLIRGKPRKMMYAVELFNRVAKSMFSDRGRCESMKDRYARYEDRHPMKVKILTQEAERNRILANRYATQRSA